METTESNRDILFGKWLSRRRCQAGWTLEDVAWKTEIAVARLRSLEIARFLKGITLREANALSQLYKVPMSTFIVQIVG